jgi:hypothetical protein
MAPDGHVRANFGAEPFKYNPNATACTMANEAAVNATVANDRRKEDGHTNEDSAKEDEHREESERDSDVYSNTTEGGSWS